MPRNKQPIEGVIVQFFYEAPLDAAESIKRIVDDVITRRRAGAGVRSSPFRDVGEDVGEGKKEKRPRRRVSNTPPPPAPVTDTIDDDEETPL